MIYTRPDTKKKRGSESCWPSELAPREAESYANAIMLVGRSDADLLLKV